MLGSLSCTQFRKHLKQWNKSRHVHSYFPLCQKYLPPWPSLTKNVHDKAHQQIAKYEIRGELAIAHMTDVPGGDVLQSFEPNTCA